MRVVLFTHSLLSDWNHGNAHFLRGIVTELALRGHPVRAYEPAGAWSRKNLVADVGEMPIERMRRRYPHVWPITYDESTFDLDAALEGADLVLVHEWNSPSLVARIGEHRASKGRYRLLFHDTHHRAVSDPEAMARFDLSSYDGVLVFGRVLRDIYLERGWARHAFVWHEAADARVFRPLGEPSDEQADIDVAWIGNWGDEERTEELVEFFIEPVRRIGLRAIAHGVRYPDAAKRMLASAGIQYAGFLPNFDVPELYARAKVTIHVPRRQYARTLPGIPTIRVFEALACGIPLVSAPWSDVEELFSSGEDFLVARSGAEMEEHLRRLLANPSLRASIAAHGRRTVLSRHTCAHRVDELLHLAAHFPEFHAQPAAAAEGA